MTFGQWFFGWRRWLFPTLEQKCETVRKAVDSGNGLYAYKAVRAKNLAYALDANLRFSDVRVANHFMQQYTAELINEAIAEQNENP